MSYGSGGQKFSVPKSTRVDLPDLLREEVAKAAAYYGEHPRTIIRLAIGKGMQHLKEVFTTGDYRSSEEP